MEDAADVNLRTIEGNNNNKLDEKHVEGEVGQGDPPPVIDSHVEEINCKFDSAIINELLVEANEMAKYISRHGDVLGSNSVALQNKLLSAIKNLSCVQNATNWVELHVAYSAVTAVTYSKDGVNGKTILDTARTPAGWKPYLFLSRRHRPIGVGILLFLTAMILEIITYWAGQKPNVTSALPVSLDKNLFLLTSPLLSFLLPAVWGGIGACIFLMKRISDKLFAQSYESEKVRGDMTRVFLGAMLGVIVVVVMFPNFNEAIKVGNFTFGPAVAAFVAGLGVKPIYAAFESLSEELAARFNRNKDKFSKVDVKNDDGVSG